MRTSGANGFRWRVAWVAEARRQSGRPKSRIGPDHGRNPGAVRLVGSWQLETANTKVCAVLLNEDFSVRQVVIPIDVVKPPPTSRNAAPRGLRRQSGTRHRRGVRACDDSGHGTPPHYSSRASSRPFGSRRAGPNPALRADRDRGRAWLRIRAGAPTEGVVRKDFRLREAGDEQSRRSPDLYNAIRRRQPNWRNDLRPTAAGTDRGVQLRRLKLLRGQ